MGAFFTRRRGQVVRLTSLGTDVSTFAIRMQGMDMGGTVNATSRAIVTRAARAADVNYQAQHSLNDTIYTYIFGDRIGDLVISGVCFGDLCGAGPASGMRQVIDNYERFKASRRPFPVLVSLGGASFRSLLIHSTLELADAENNLGNWTFRFISLTPPI